MNITEEALKLGYKTPDKFPVKTEDVRPYDNWFGVSVYHPLLRLVKGNKEIQMSIGVPLNNIYKGIHVKEIKIKQGDETLYYSSQGVIPINFIELI
tara:strand:+ start:210 stop:497 length:288 start_codon:yes stop_codon:yes gene_type:complete